jgi:hypothetical protein
MRLRTIVLVVLALAVVASTLYVRWRRQSRVPEAPPEADVIPTPPASEPVTTPADAAPTPSELQATLDRLFEQSLLVDRQIRPSFVTGDFSGDSLADLAVAVRPRDEAALSRLNAALPRCRLQDATAAMEAPGDASAPIAPGDHLLAVVHGVAGASWSGGADRPCYLVRNAVGPGMSAQPLSEVPPAIRMRVSRAHAGDVIVQERGAGRGLVFWTGAAYAWADLPNGGHSTR